MSEIAELFYPAIRWDAQRGYEGEREAIEVALKLGVGGSFCSVVRRSSRRVDGTPSLEAEHPLLIVRTSERGADNNSPDRRRCRAGGDRRHWEDIQAVFLRRAPPNKRAEARELGIKLDLRSRLRHRRRAEQSIIGTRSFGSDPARCVNTPPPGSMRVSRRCACVREAFSGARPHRS